MAYLNAFPKAITASKWTTVHDAMMEAARKAHAGVATLTNGELESLVRSWRVLVGGSGFPLWSQFAAAGYGWSPAKPERLNGSAKQQVALVDDELAADFWQTTRELAEQLDNTRGGVNGVSLPIDATAFIDPVWRASVIADIKSDAPKAEWKVPTPACKDKKTGKSHLPHFECKPGWRLVREGVNFVCVAPDGRREAPTYKCDEPVMVDDPITIIGRDFSRLGLLILAGYLVWRHETRPRRGKR